MIALSNRNLSSVYTDMKLWNKVFLTRILIKINYLHYNKIIITLHKTNFSEHEPSLTIIALTVITEWIEMLIKFVFSWRNYFIHSMICEPVSIYFIGMVSLATIKICEYTPRVVQNVSSLFLRLWRVWRRLSDWSHRRYKFYSVTKLMLITSGETLCKSRAII